MTEYMNTDGSFGDMAGAPDGMATLVDKKGWANVEAITKSYTELEAHQGTLKQNLNLPETLTDDMMARIQTKLGKPDSPDKYDFGEAGKTFKPEVLNGIQGLAYKNGLNNAQANAIVNQILEIANVEIAGEQTRIEAVETALKAKHGDKYDTYMEEALSVSDTLGITGTLDKTGLNNNPEIIEMLHAMKAKLSEASLKTPGSLTAESGTIDEKLKAITESDAYKERLHVDHHSKMVEFNGLLAQKHNVQVAQVAAG